VVFMAAPAELVRDFVNTYEVESDTDELSSPADLAVWLRERELIHGHDRAGEEDLRTGVTLREALRAALRDEPGDLPPLPLRVTAAATLEPVEDGVAGGLARIAAAVVAARAEGSWERLKVCAEPSCQWAFVDSSKNRSRSWCSMKICGNRTKTRAYRARRHRQVRITDTV
jgi:predicted RNA-binding Zn ribbon-like protein